MNETLLLLVKLSALSLLVPACNIETHTGDQPGAADPDCAAFCLRLNDCGSLSTSAVGDCIDVCEARMSLDSNATRAGCQCVANDACRPASAYQCPGAPFPRGDGGSGGARSTGPGGGTGGGGTASGGTASGGAASGGAAGASSGGTGGSSSCAADPDCPTGEDCVSGTCRTRCVASCQCPQGFSCVSSYCEDAPPPASCTTDCDCPAGDRCVAGACG